MPIFCPPSSVSSLQVCQIQGTEDMSPAHRWNTASLSTLPRMRQCQQKRTAATDRAQRPTLLLASRRSDTPMSLRGSTGSSQSTEAEARHPARGPALTACDSGTVPNISGACCCEDSSERRERRFAAPRHRGTTLHRWHRLPIFGGDANRRLLFLFSAVRPGGSRFPREGLDPGLNQGN